MTPRTGHVVALYSLFNAQDLVRNAMLSLLPLVDEYLVYDGRFEAFRCPCGKEHDSSCDKTLDEVERFKSDTGAKVKVVQAPAMPEFDKRNAMFDAVGNGDTCIVADDDEIFYGRLGQVAEFSLPGFGWATLQANIVCLRWLRSFDPLPRVFVKRPGLRYIQLEASYSYTFADANGQIKPEEFALLDHVRLVNLYGTYNEVGYRSRERDGARSAYNELGIQRKLPTGKTTRP